jgi:hypothetical protein
MTDNRAGTLELIAVNVARAFRPLRTHLDGPLAIDLFADLGVLFPDELAQNTAFQGALSSARQALDVLPRAIDALLIAVDTGDFLAALERFGDLQSGLDGAGNALEQVADALNAAAAAGATPGFSAAEVSAFTNGLPRRLLDWSFINYFETALPVLTALLDLLGVFERNEEQVGSTNPKFPQYTRRVLRLDRLPRALSSPFGALEDLYGFGTAGFDGVALFAKIASIFSQAGLPAVNDAGGVDLVFAELTRNTAVSPPGLDLLLKTGFDQEFRLERPPLVVTATTRILAPVGSTLTLQADRGMALTAPASGSAEGELRLAVQADNSAEPIVLLGRAEGNRLDLSGFTLGAGVGLAWDGTAARGTFEVSAELQKLHLVLGAPEGDGFLAELMPGSGVDATFDLGLRLGSSGFQFTGSGGLRLVLPLHLDLGVVTVDEVTVGVQLESGEVIVPVGARIRGAFGPVQAAVDGIGIEAVFSFPPDSSRTPIDVDIAFKSPTAVGILIEGGAVRGGGFLALEENRYFGAVELSVFSVPVKAFGLIETRLPDGSAGFSFVIVISAEFTPVQLGFGFTLLGVGGLLGVNRTVDEQGLGDAVRTGSLEHLLFPRNPVQDAPAIVHDLATVFPAARGHFIFGPLGKFGWGTPTLISANIGIVLEFPGPRLALLGVARMQLPSPEFSLLRLQMAIAGLLDFPAKTMAVDASLFDSNVVGYPIAGDMAFRLGFGDNANFLLSVGGFNPSFDPPPGVPELRRASVDLGVNGNPSLTASGYFALTSNTAQIGARIELRASGAGIRLNGHLGFDALFVFAPFSFTASFSAGMRVSFHGAGIGVTLRGSLRGPTPWHINGKVCVSVLWWDACLSVDHKFGRGEPAALPQMDPWLGTPQDADPRVAVIGLANAIADARNWSGSNPPAGFGVVSLAAAATATTTPIDPLGAATLRQKVVPLETEIQKFGEYRPTGHDRFFRSSVAVNGDVVPEAEISSVSDDFAPAKFLDFDDADKLSMDSYVEMDAGFSVNADRVTIGSEGSQVLAYETDFITADGETFEDPITYIPTQAQLLGMLKRSAVALGGIRRAGPRKYIVPTKPKKVTLGPKRFLVVDSCTSVKNDTIVGTHVTQVQALLALRNHVRANPADAGKFAIAPVHAALPG